MGQWGKGLGRARENAPDAFRQSANTEMPFRNFGKGAAFLRRCLKFKEVASETSLESAKLTRMQYVPSSEIV